VEFITSTTSSPNRQLKINELYSLKYETADQHVRDLISFMILHVQRSDFRTWEADHIVPVVEGGGLCGLENYRTLCSVCHKKVTAALRKRLKRST
jgi:hypothetical protein